jgi:predicted dienelactone hydrolase
MTILRRRCRQTLVVLMMGASVGAPLAAQQYDPLRLPTTALAPPRDFTIRDAARSRDIPVRVYLPAVAAAAPVVLFSHGLGGSRTNNAYLANHWAARGYVVVAMQHAGSDESVLKGARPLQAVAALTKAASAENLLRRLDDVRAVLDELTRWQSESGHPLRGRLNLTRIAMSGHSFGALTTQGVSGQRFPILGTTRTDPRIKAAIILSPSAPHGGDAKRAFGDVSLPWLLMTGTNDVAEIGDATLEDRLAVFPALSGKGDAYELVLDGAEHNAFGDAPERKGQKPRNPAHHKAIQAISTAFLDAHLREQSGARSWLRGESARTVLHGADKWQYK